MKELQKELDDKVNSYNNHQTHQYKIYYGRITLDTLRDEEMVWVEKNLAQI